MKITRKSFIQYIGGMFGAGLWLREAKLAKAGEIPVKLRPLGRTGMMVSPIGIGASRSREPALLKAAFERGINFIDTGRNYGNGQNEIMVEQAIRGNREKLVIQSKIKLPDEDGKGFSQRKILSHLKALTEESLNALGTEYIDSMLIHGIEEEEILEWDGVLRYFEVAMKEGKIRASGFSAHRNHLSLLEKATKLASFDVVMIPFNPFGGFRHSISGWTTSWDQEKLIALMSNAHEMGIAVLAMKTCSGGTYAYHPDSEPSFGGAVRWVAEKPYISSAMIAMANYRELEDHARILDKI